MERTKYLIIGGSNLIPKYMLPNFLIIGAQRAGTTTLHRYLTSHPEVTSASKKEIHFFDINYDKGINWYLNHFSSSNLNNKNGKITGEASPYYIFHPLVPKRIFETIPKIKLIILLRNPIDRAYSHYNLITQMKYETLSFEDAIKSEPKRLKIETEKVLKGYYSQVHQYYSYVSRGIYVDQLKRWFDLFPKKQILILKSEDFFDTPELILKRVWDFLNLPAVEIKQFEKYNSGDYPQMKETTRKFLIDFFKPHNEMLYDFVGKNFDW